VRRRLLEVRPGSVLLRARYYNPGAGRFDKSDSLFLREPERCFERPEECQLYSYVANNPVRWVDGDGRSIRFPSNKGSELWYYLFADEKHPTLGMQRIRGAALGQITEINKAINESVKWMRNVEQKLAKIDQRTQDALCNYLAVPVPGKKCDCLQESLQDPQQVKSDLEMTRKWLKNSGWHNYRIVDLSARSVVLENGSTVSISDAYAFTWVEKGKIYIDPTSIKSGNEFTGTIFHEGTHAILGTGDYGNYGNLGALEYAKKNTNSLEPAEKSANNLEFFVRFLENALN
jgi:RHS repeat-associated protein